MTAPQIPDTESVSARFDTMDLWPTADLVAGMVEGQFAAVAAVQAASDAIARAVDAAADRLRDGGRLIYMGAGTSGRIATQDAVELRPTFNWPADRALALMAGGEGALLHAREGAEDDESEAVAALDAAGLTPADVVIGVAASGRTPYTVAGVRHARGRGALTLGVFNNRGAALGQAADIAVLLDTGPEFLAGSTRLKAGTAQKVALNAFSTGVMIRLGLVYRGQMVAMRPTNAKLRDRAADMVARLSGSSTDAGRKALAAAGGSIPIATLMLAQALDADTARAAVAAAGGNLRLALERRT